MIISKLTLKLKTIFKMDHRNILLFAHIIIAIIQHRTVNLAKLVPSLGSKTKVTSRYKRLQRFIWNFKFDRVLIAEFLASCLHWTKKYTIAIDRTNWNYWRFKINILILWIVYKGMSIPVLWMLLDKKWNSRSQERITLVQDFIKIFWDDSVELVLWDREFIGYEWVSRLMSMHIEFGLRVRNNTILQWYGKSKHIYRSFRYDPYYKARSLKKARTIRWLKMYITGMKTKDEYLIIITKSYQPNIIEIYQHRREIETLFGNMKSRWFNLEDTHLQKHERINTMICILAICVVRAHAIWERKQTQEPISIKTHGRKQYSIFRYWLDVLRDICYSVVPNHKLITTVLLLLYCT